MAEHESPHQVWLPVIGRSLAYLCMNSANLGDKRLVEKAKFLEALGLDRRHVAAMLDTTPASITELYRQEKQKKAGGRKNAATKRRK